MPNLRLVYAERACAYVDSQGVKSNNRFENGQNLQVPNGAMGNLRNDVQGAQYTLENIRSRADLAKARKIGNCHEKAAIAFVYLYDTYGPKCGGLALVGTAQFNHAFLVIGVPRPRRADVAQIEGTLANPPGDWGNAVVCDPWYHEWYEMADFRAKMRQTLIESSRARRIGDNEALGFSYEGRG